MIWCQLAAALCVGLGAPAGGPALTPSAEAVRPLPFFYDLYTFRGSAGSTTVVAAFAVPVSGLERESADPGVRYRFDVSLVLTDTRIGSVSRTDDSVFVGVPTPLAGGHLLHTHIEMEAPASSSIIQRAIVTDATTPGRGLFEESDFPIPDYGGDTLMLSDVALGRPGTEGGWRRGEATLALLPTSHIPETDFDVYYEVYNLPAERRYTTELTIEAMDDRGEAPRADSPPVRARFSGTSTSGTDGTLPELRQVNASLRRGHYRLTVLVTDQESGRTASRTRHFEVREWGRGATLVQALRHLRATPG